MELIPFLVRIRTSKAVHPSAGTVLRSLFMLLIFAFVFLSVRSVSADATHSSNSNHPSLAATTVMPAADAYVDSSNPAVNYGTLDRLKVDGSPVLNSYVRFTVSGLSGPITKATLSLYALASSSSGVTVHAVSDNTWGETTITFQTAPPFSSTVIGTSGALTKNKRVTIDVTSYVSGNGTFSLAVTTSNLSGKTFASREAGTNGPQLILQVGTTPTSTSLPTATQAPAATSTPTITPSPTNLPATPTSTNISAPTNTPTNTPLPTPTDPALATSTATNTPTDTPLPPTSTPTITPSPTATSTLAPVATNTTTPSPTASPTSTLSPTAAPTPSPTGTPVTNIAPPNFSHVYTILMENHEYTDIVGSTSAPYMNSLISQYGLATNYDAVAHPSLPNYLALFSGSTQGVTDDGTYNLSATNVADQIEASGRTWKMFAENYPLNCYTGSSYSGGEDGTGTYARKHEPAISFTDISGNATLCANITDLAHFDPSAANYEFITPNLCDDMHDCSISVGDTFLQGFVPNILNSPAWQQGGVLFIVWDEGTTSTGGGGHVANIVIASNVTVGLRSATFFNHYSLLRTIEDAWGLTCLASTCSSNNMAEFFH